jgi:hypothetical protein
MRVLTPCDLDVLMHYYIIDTPHTNQAFPALRESLDYLRSKNLINENSFVLTGKGLAHVEQLLSLSFPTLIYVNDQDEKIMECIE